MLAGLDLGSPFVIALTGCQLWTYGSESPPPTGEPCWCCGAIRDERGKVVAGGIETGDRLGCAACTCLEPWLERTADRRGKPAQEPPRKGRPRAEFSLRERRKAARTPDGRVRLAMWDAEADGDTERAARLQTLLYRHRDGLIDDAELDRLAGVVLAQDGVAA